MALNDLKVFSDFLYTTATEVLQQNIELFNSASSGCIVLATEKHVGDYSDKISFAKVAGGLTRRRDAYGMGAIATKHMSHLDETMVKVAAGTPTIEMNPNQWAWLQRSPEEAAAAMALQLSIDTMADMVNTAVGCVATALAGQANVVNDISAAAGDAPAGNNSTPYPANRISPIVLNDTVAKFGDAGGRIQLWLMHSTPMYQLLGNALANVNNLFNYGTVAVREDGMGRRYIMSDCPALANAGQTKFYTLGLTPGAVKVAQQDDFNDNWDSRNGLENISKTYQAEWSYMVGVRGFAWDKTNGGKSPTDAALFSTSNWDRFVTADKDLPGVVLISAKARAA